MGKSEDDATSDCMFNVDRINPSSDCIGAVKRRCAYLFCSLRGKRSRLRIGKGKSRETTCKKASKVELQTA